MVGVKLKDVTKRFGTTIAVNTVSLDVNRGELFFLLGPSGCGKTTLLRLIAGFVEPDAGEIWFDGRLMNNVPAHLRNAAMVFQNYALFPHMTVWENVAYGLRLRNLSKREQAERIRWALELVRMSEFKDRYPGQLSGGQQQRIALARALIVQPDVLLLDEPLSNLDARLRAEMRREIKRIHRQLRITTIYVTHDQKEALSMADRIAVMRNGCVEQVGTPRELYYHPRNRYVAEFIGDANLIQGRVQAISGRTIAIETPFGVIESFYDSIEHEWKDGDEVICAIRPEALQLQPIDKAIGCDDSLPNTMRAQIMDVTYLGDVESYELVISGQCSGEARKLKLHAVRTNPHGEQVCEGNEVIIKFDPSDVIIIPADSAPQGSIA